MRGQKHSPEVKTKCLMLMAQVDNLREVSQLTGIPISTVEQWKREEHLEEEFVKLQGEYKMQFAVDSLGLIKQAQALAEKRLSTALKHEEAITALIDEITRDGKISDATKQMAVSKLRTMQVNSIKDLSTFIGTIYDKMALASGQSTQNIAVLTIEQQLEQLDEDD